MRENAPRQASQTGRGGYLAIAHSLDLDVVAEGVETDAQLAFLRSLGCDTGRGYLFSKPLSAEELPAALARPFPLPRSSALALAER